MKDLKFQRGYFGLHEIFVNVPTEKFQDKKEVEEFLSSSFFDWSLDREDVKKLHKKFLDTCKDFSSKKALLTVHNLLLIEKLCNELDKAIDVTGQEIAGL